MSFDVKNLRFAYGEQEVLRGVSFHAEAGEIVSVLGPNGVGKSTMFRCILGFHRDYSGEIYIGGRDAKEMSAAELAKEIAYIPQSHYPAFNYSVFNMVLMGTCSHFSFLTSPGKKQREAAMRALERVGIAHLAEKSYLRISGGERQLVLIARALVQEAKILILDEPTANLDYGNQLRVMEQLRQLTEEGYMILQSTHNPEQAFLFSDQVVALKDGCVLAAGAPEDVLTEQRISDLYSADVEVHSIHGDKLRVCVPKFILKRGQNNE